VSLTVNNKKIKTSRWSKKTRRDGELHGESISTVKRALEAILVASKEDGMSYCLVNGFVGQNQNTKVLSGSREVQMFYNDPSIWKVD
jgi:hypothetical protein